MDAETIVVKIILPVLAFIVATLVPSIIAIVKKAKDAKAAKEAAAAAKTEAERIAAEEEYQKILHELRDTAINLVSEAEVAFKDINETLKARTGTGCGALKKKIVLSDIQAACQEKGIEFDKDYWDDEIEKIVAVTKQVN